MVERCTRWKILGSRPLTRFFMATRKNVDLACGYFRNAVILQQIYYRYVHGQTRDRRFARFGQITQQLGEHCRSLINAA